MKYLYLYDSKCDASAIEDKSVIRGIGTSDTVKIEYPGKDVKKKILDDIENWLIANKV